MITDYILDRVQAILSEGKTMTYAAKRVGHRSSELRQELANRRGVIVPDARKPARRVIYTAPTFEICQGSIHGPCPSEYGYRLRKNEGQCPYCYSMDLAGRPPMIEDVQLIGSEAMA